MKILRPGSRVKINDIPAKVVQACIRADESVHYEVAWWDGRTRKSCWVEAFELKEVDEPRRIGFVNPAHEAGPQRIPSL